MSHYKDALTLITDIIAVNFDNRMYRISAISGHNAEYFGSSGGLYSHQFPVDSKASYRFLGHRPVCIFPQSLQKSALIVDRP
jgi:hypothetical protein